MSTRRGKTPRVLARHDARLKIQVPKLIKQLENNALRKLDPPLNQTEVNSIKILLAKALPDLSTIKHDMTEKPAGYVITWGE